MDDFVNPTAHTIEASTRKCYNIDEFPSHSRLSMQRTKEDIHALIKKGETFHLECKKAQGGLPSSLWESYSAFCNTDGGVWMKSAFPPPSISESYDPDRTTIVLKLDEERLAQQTEPKLGQNNKGRVKTECTHAKNLILRKAVR